MTLSRAEQDRRDTKRAVEEAVRKGHLFAVQCAFDGRLMGIGTTHATLELAEASRDAVFERTDVGDTGDVHARPEDFMKLEVFIAELKSGESHKMVGTSRCGYYDSAR